jgi:hypothetical protein
VLTSARANSFQSDCLSTLLLSAKQTQTLQSSRDVLSAGNSAAVAGISTPFLGCAGRFGGLIESVKPQSRILGERRKFAHGNDADHLAGRDPADFISGANVIGKSSAGT